MAQKNDRNKNTLTKQNTPSNELQVEASYFVGPFPPPAVVQEYENIQAGFAERIFSYAESEQSHRHAIQNAQVATGGREVSVSFWAHAITNVCITAMFISLMAAGCYAL